MPEVCGLQNLELEGHGYYGKVEDLGKSCQPSFAEDSLLKTKMNFEAPNTGRPSPALLFIDYIALARALL